MGRAPGAGATSPTSHVTTAVTAATSATGSDHRSMVARQYRAETDSPSPRVTPAGSDVKAMVGTGKAYRQRRSYCEA